VTAGDPGRAPAVLKVGLTGNAGSGKSTVARIWGERGVEVIDADELAREVVDTSPELRRRLALEFGDEILEPAPGAQVGALKRQELARRAFASPERTRALNRLVHPPLIELLRRRLRDAGGTRARAGSRLVAADAALIFELGVEDLFDVIVLVMAPLDVRLERLRARGLDDATIQGLVGRQIPDADKVGRAHHVLVNDTSLEALRSRARDLLARIATSAAILGAQARDGGAPASLPDR
jgi:dephospho-CoA kinase